jgi:hypothetical protein
MIQKSCAYRIQYVMIVYERSFHTTRIFSCQTVGWSRRVSTVFQSFWNFWAFQSVIFWVEQKHGAQKHVDKVKAFRLVKFKNIWAVQKFQISICHDLRLRLKSQFYKKRREMVRYDLRRTLKSLRRSAPYAEIVCGKSTTNLDPTARFQLWKTVRSIVAVRVRSTST